MAKGPKEITTPEDWMDEIVDLLESYWKSEIPRERAQRMLWNMAIAWENVFTVAKRFKEFLKTIWGSAFLDDQIIFCEKLEEFGLKKLADKLRAVAPDRHKKVLRHIKIDVYNGKTIVLSLGKISLAYKFGKLVKDVNDGKAPVTDYMLFLLQTVPEAEVDNIARVDLRSEATAFFREVITAVLLKIKRGEIIPFDSPEDEQAFMRFLDCLQELDPQGIIVIEEGEKLNDVMMGYTDDEIKEGIIIYPHLKEVWIPSRVLSGLAFSVQSKRFITILKNAGVLKYLTRKKICGLTVRYWVFDLEKLESYGWDWKKLIEEREGGGDEAESGDRRTGDG